MHCIALLDKPPPQKPYNEHGILHQGRTKLHLEFRFIVVSLALSERVTQMMVNRQHAK